MFESMKPEKVNEMNTTFVKLEDLKAIIASRGPLAVGKDFACDTPELRRIFGHAPLGRVLILELRDRGDGTTRIDWS